MAERSLCRSRAMRKAKRGLKPKAPAVSTALVGSVVLLWLLAPMAITAVVTLVVFFLLFTAPNIVTLTRKVS